jgi:hypothetical protein
LGEASRAQAANELHVLIDNRQGVCVELGHKIERIYGVLARVERAQF